MKCQKRHRFYEKFYNLPFDQGGIGRHKCAACAYEHGYEAGLLKKVHLFAELDSLSESQAGTVRHKSPRVAYAQGYFEGIVDSYYKKSIVS